jgi:uncharacterized protein YbjT (DUF2867 family)
MYAITGITGKVGGQTAHTLLAGGKKVRAVLRDARKGESWERSGCSVAIAEMNDAKALTAAFKGATGVFILLPPIFDPSPGFPEARATIAALRSALEAARPAKVVCLSTIGAQASQENLLSQLGLMEQPLEKSLPMVATADVGRVAAELLQENWSGHRVVELQGPTRIAPNDIAATFTDLLGRLVKVQAVPRDTWETLFRSQGMTNPLPRMQMLDGFNQGWLEFEYGEADSRKGRVTLKEVLSALIDGT